MKIIKKGLIPKERITWYGTVCTRCSAEVIFSQYDPDVKFTDCNSKTIYNFECPCCGYQKSNDVDYEYTATLEKDEVPDAHTIWTLGKKVLRLSNVYRFYHMVPGQGVIPIEEMEINSNITPCEEGN